MVCNKSHFQIYPMTGGDHEATTLSDWLTRNSQSVSIFTLSKWYFRKCCLCCEKVDFSTSSDRSRKGWKAKKQRKKGEKGWMKKRLCCLCLASPEGEAFVAPLSSLHSLLPLKIARIKGERAHHWILNVLNMDREASLALQAGLGWATNVSENVYYIYYAHEAAIWGHL